MTTSIDTGVRETAVYTLAPGIVARGQNFFVQWLQGDGTVFEAHSAHEMLLLLPEDGAEVRVGQTAAQSVLGRSVCVLPAGDIAVQPKDGGRAVLIASSRADLAPGAACNEHDYASPDARIGGSDADSNLTAARSVADAAALPIAYKSGLVSSGVQLAKVPIIDLRG